ncbi:MBL fold metallo-hydrolase [bacterium]|nr:MBL fold metallo-hydrolase [bacterium]
MQITAHIHALHVPFQVPLPTGPLERFVVVYLVYGEHRVWLVDAGVAGAEGRVFDYLRQTGRSPDDVAGLLLTHAHPDHVGAAAAIQARTGCPVLVHAAERAWVEDVDRQARERPVPGFSTLVGGPASVTGLLADGGTVELEPGLAVEVIHTPGHSPGSVSLLLVAEGALFTGDVVLSPGDLPIYDSAAVLQASLARLQALPALEVMLSAWDEARRGEEIPRRLAESQEYLRKIAAAVEAAAEAGATDLCAAVLPQLGLPSAAANPLIARTLQSHRSGSG